MPSLVVGLTGMPGSGKTLVASELVSRFAYRCVGLGSLLTEVPENSADPQATVERWRAASELRERMGAAVLAERAWSVINSADDQRFVVDGIRSLDECAYFSKRSEFFLAAFQRPAALRYVRLRASRRTSLFRSDPKALYALDRQELILGTGNVVAQADFIWFSTAGEARLPTDAARAAKQIHLAASSSSDALTAGGDVAGPDRYACILGN